MVPKTRKMPAVISTFALIAGCSSSTDAEVSGLVVAAHEDFTSSIPDHLGMPWDETNERYSIWDPGEQWALGAHANWDSSCETCHEGRSEPSSFDLVAYEYSEVAGASVEGLGSGAVCVECHRDVGELSRMPQADVMLGRGSRLLPSSSHVPSPHAVIADSCVACHIAPEHPADPEALTLGHTFMASDSQGQIANSGCRACHGPGAPDEIGRGDWDGDGLSGSLREEHDRALGRARRRVEALVRQAGITRRCGTTRRTAWSFREHEGDIVLVDQRTVMLGDCNEDGVFEPNERVTTIDTLPERIAHAAFDLVRLERDGSRGIHHPRFAFAVLGAIESRL